MATLWDGNISNGNQAGGCTHKVFGGKVGELIFLARNNHHMHTCWCLLECSNEVIFAQQEILLMLANTD